MFNVVRPVSTCHPRATAIMALSTGTRGSRGKASKMYPPGIPCLRDSAIPPARRPTRKETGILTNHRILLGRRSNRGTKTRANNAPRARSTRPKTIKSPAVAMIKSKVPLGRSDRMAASTVSDNATTCRARLSHHSSAGERWRRSNTSPDARRSTWKPTSIWPSLTGCISSIQVKRQKLGSASIGSSMPQLPA